MDALTGKAAFLLLVTVALIAAPRSGNAEERTVYGTITGLERESRSVSVQDGKGVVWKYRVDKDSGIDLGEFRVGDYVSVTLARATPLNMVTSADILRKGDRIVRFPER